MYILYNNLADGRRVRLIWLENKNRDALSENEYFIALATEQEYVLHIYMQYVALQAVYALLTQRENLYLP